jgi:signal transduction histidine kinase
MESNSQLHLRRAEPRMATNLLPALSIPSATAVAASSPRPAIDVQLMRLEQLASLGTLSAGLAHEVRNAMVAVRTFIEVLLTENKTSELAEIVRRELVRIDSLLSQMLRGASNPTPQYARVSLQEILERSLRLIEPHSRARKIQLRCACVASPDMVHADQHQLEQAFLNLLLNACDAIGRDGEIRVETRIARLGRKAGSWIPSPAGRGQGEGEGNVGESKRRRRIGNSLGKVNGSNALEVLISDTGGGMSKQQLSRVFEPFYTTKANGTGLGLSITREIIEAHHGSISVQSQPNEGTTFRISFPSAQIHSSSR